YDALATTSGAAGPDTLSVTQILALPTDKRTAKQVARLREHYTQEHVPALKEIAGRIAAARKQRDEMAKKTPLALVWEEMERPRPAHILTRGDYLQPAETVERNVPAIFPPLGASAPRDRLALARWLVS